MQSSSGRACVALFTIILTAHSALAAPPAGDPFNTSTEWQSFGPSTQTLRPADRWSTSNFSEPQVEPVTNLVPSRGFELPELPVPVVDPAAAQLVSPRLAPPALPVTLAAPEPASTIDEPAPLPKPLKSAASSEALPKSAADDLDGVLHGMAWTTGTIGVGAVLSLWLVRLWLTRGQRGMTPTRSMKVVETLRMGPRCGLYLVEAESHRVLVGVEQGKSMCLLPLPANFTESLHEAAADTDSTAADFDRIADVFSARRSAERRSEGAA